MKDNTATVGRGPRKISLRHALMITQVALSMVALISAGLFVRSVREAYKADPGFDPHGVLLASFDPFLSGATLSIGQERSKENAALTAEPCCASDSSPALNHRASLTEFQNHTTTPKGRTTLSRGSAVVRGFHKRNGHVGSEALIIGYAEVIPNGDLGN